MLIERWRTTSTAPQKLMVMGTAAALRVECNAADPLDLLDCSNALQGFNQEDELLRWARAGEVRLGALGARPQYERPNRKRQLPHEGVMAMLNAVRGDL